MLSAARDLFVGNGYTATTVAQIAALAQVSVDTIYATVGRKPALLREVVEIAISGTDQAVPHEQRDYVIRIGAATTDPDCAALRTEIAARRAASMRTFAADLRRTTELPISCFLAVNQISDFVLVYAP